MYLFNAVFKRRHINPASEQADQWVLNTRYEHWVSSGNEEDTPEPKSFRTNEGLNFTKKMCQSFTEVAVPMQDRSKLHGFRQIKRANTQFEPAKWSDIDGQ